MGTKERRDIEKLEMKNKIMNAAIEIIEQDGYEKLSMRKIANKIEYSPTTIYLYYKDKSDIISDITKDLYTKVVEDIVNVQNSSQPIDEKIASLIKIFIVDLCNEPQMCKTVMYSGANTIFTNQLKNGKPSNDGIEMLDKLLEEGIALGVFNRNVFGTAWMIISATLGFVMNCIENKLYDTEEFNNLIDEFVNLLVGGIK